MSVSTHRAIPVAQPLGAGDVRHGGRRTDHGRGLSGYGHSMQFYEDERFLVQTVVDFFAAGLVGGQRAVAVATPEHRAAFASGLHAKGVDVGSATGWGSDCPSAARSREAWEATWWPTACSGWDPR